MAAGKVAAPENFGDGCGVLSGGREKGSGGGDGGGDGGGEGGEDEHMLFVSIPREFSCSPPIMMAGFSIDLCRFSWKFNFWLTTGGFSSSIRGACTTNDPFLSLVTARLVAEGTGDASSEREECNAARGLDESKYSGRCSRLCSVLERAGVGEVVKERIAVGGFRCIACFSRFSHICLSRLLKEDAEEGRTLSGIEEEETNGWRVCGEDDEKVNAFWIKRALSGCGHFITSAEVG